MSSFGSGGDGGRGGNPANGRANFDHNVGGSNRDPWNRPILRENPGNDGRNQNDNSGNNDSNRNTNTNNNGVDEDIIATIWSNADDQNKGKGKNDTNTNTNTNTNANTNTNTDTRTPEEKQAAYLKSVGIEPITLTDQEKERLQGGDMSVIVDQMGRMQAQLVSSHINALKGADTMIQSAVANAIKTAKSETQSEILGEMNKKALESKLPWTKDPAIGPMAQAVMQRFLGKGLSTEDAIKNVERYYDYQDNKRGRGVNTNRSGGFNDTGEKPFQAPEGGWLKILSGQ